MRILPQTSQTAQSIQTRAKPEREAEKLGPFILITELTLLRPRASRKVCLAELGRVALEAEFTHDTATIVLILLIILEELVIF